MNVSRKFSKTTTTTKLYEYCVDCVSAAEWPFGIGEGGEGGGR